MNTDARRPLVGLSLLAGPVGASAGARLDRRPFVMDDLGEHVVFRLVASRDETQQRDAGPWPAPHEASALCGLVLIDRPGNAQDKRRDCVDAELFSVMQGGTIPLLPVVRDHRLADEGVRDRFLTRVFTLHRWRQTCGSEPTMSNLQAFHAANKSLLTAHDESSTRALGRSIATCGSAETADLANAYIEQAMRILNRPAGRGAHVNVLQHVLGHFRGILEQPTRIALHETLREYAQGQVRLAAIRGVFLEHAKSVGSPWLREQTYFAPYPAALCEEG